MPMTLVLVLLAGLSFAASAEPAAPPPATEAGIFVCTASRVMELAANGELASTDFAKAVAMYESRFAVDRGTGMAMGGAFGTWDAKDVQVLSPGSDTESFKVLYLAETEYTHLKYLSVNTYVAGKQKPFLGITGNIVITGLCE